MKMVKNKKIMKKDHTRMLNPIDNYEHIQDSNGLSAHDAGGGRQRLHVRIVERECAMIAQQTAGTVGNSCVRIVEADINVLHLHVHTRGNRLQQTHLSTGR